MIGGGRLQKQAMESQSRVSVELADLVALRYQAALLQQHQPHSLAVNSGTRVSRLRGRGMEFDEVRPYVAGDDIRSIDWRVTARTGRAHTKMFREERDHEALLVVDLQQSMHFATRGVFKSVLASQLAALLAWQAHIRGDHLGGMIIADHDHIEERPRAGRRPVLTILHHIARHKSWQDSQKELIQEQSGLADILLRLRRVSRPGAQITIISDFRQLEQDDEIHIRELSRHASLRFLLIKDQLERDLPSGDNYWVSDGLKSLKLNTQQQRVRQRYHEEYQDLTEWLEGLNRSYGVALLEADSRDDPYEVMQRPWIGRRRFRSA